MTDAAPGPGFEVLARGVAAEFGYRLLTVMAFNAARQTNRRAWSSQPERWPVGGEKPVAPGSSLHRTVLVEGKIRHLEGRQAIEAAFADHALIVAAGCESALNVPMRWKGQVVGALNLLHRAGHYAGADFARLQSIADANAHLLAGG